MDIKKLFLLEKKATKGLLPHEWVIIGYAVLTFCFVLIGWESYSNISALAWTRVKLVGATLALWGIYRLAPCRMSMLLRIVVQLILLGEWYPDTYEINKVLPNLDHVVAQWEQSIFNMQPGQTFSETMPWWWVSEPMHLGYGSYYFLLGGVPLLYFMHRYDEFLRTSFIVLSAFFAFYLFFDLMPVTGPQFYFEAVGLDKIREGIFPEMGTYFATHQECLPIPGADGPFKAFVQIMHDAGERPTAAFPSSHVGASTVLLMLAIRFCRKQKSWTTMYWFMPLYILLCFSTVYIKAHYAVDAMAGVPFGIAFYFILAAIYDRIKG